MNRFITFFLGNKMRLLFLFYLAIALILSIQFNSFHQAKYLNSSWAVSGSLFSKIARFNAYWTLDKTNDILVEENRILQERLANNLHVIQDSTSTTFKYQFIPVTIVKNSFALSNNYLTINKGLKDSIKVDMGLMNSKGVLGIVEQVSNHYAIVQSILNSQSKINAKIASNNYFGSLIWEGKDPNIATLIDVPNIAQLQVGDTISTAGMSSIFPENIPIGKIISYELAPSQGDYIIQVGLFNDMRNLHNAYIINNHHQKEIEQLENRVHGSE